MNKSSHQAKKVGQVYSFDQYFHDKAKKKKKYPYILRLVILKVFDIAQESLSVC